MFFEPRRIFRLQTNCLDDFKTGLPLFQQYWQQRRRMLHVAIHSNHRLAACMVHAAGQRNLMPEVACQQNRPYAPILPDYLLQNRRGIIG